MKLAEGILFSGRSVMISHDHGEIIVEVMERSEGHIYMRTEYLRIHIFPWFRRPLRDRIYNAVVALDHEIAAVKNPPARDDELVKTAEDALYWLARDKRGDHLP